MGRGIVAIERGGQAAQRGGRDVVRQRFGAAHPFAQAGEQGVEAVDRGRGQLEVVDAAATAGPEGRRLVENGSGLSKTARQAVGYQEVLAHLEGAYRLEDAVEKAKARTRRFARKQETWFRSLSECRFVDLRGDVPPDEVAERILELGINK